MIFSIFAWVISYQGLHPSQRNTSEVKAAGDFRTQTVKMVIQTGQLTGTAIAPTNFQAVDPDKTIALIAGITQHALGDRVNSTQNVDDISAAIELTDGSTITATRAIVATRPTEIWVLLIEYIGTDGGPNEFLVRDRRIVDWTDGNATETYGPISDVGNNADVVVFNSGVVNPNTASDHYDRGDVRSYIDGALSVNLSRGDNVGAIRSSHQVVEFTGTSWTIQQGDAVPDQDPNGTDIAITPVADIANAFTYFTWETDAPNLDERGHRIWLTTTSNLRVQEHAAATGTKNIRWYVIENPDMDVQTGAADNQYAQLTQASITGFTDVEDLSRSFVWMSGMTNGSGNAHPRDMWQFELADAGTINIERGYSGQNLDYRYFVIELPLGPAPSLQQMHYHWRNDDGTEDTATSATGGVEDTPFVDISKNQLLRLRMQVSNQGTLVSGFAPFRIEYGEKETSCELVSSWVDIGEIGGAFDMADSINLSDGEETTNIDVSIGGVTDENATFKLFNGGVRDLSSEATGVTLSQFEFIELEYAFAATGDAEDGATYCFRVSNAGVDLDAYQVYAEAKLESFNDFLIQRGSFQMSGTSQTITAGVDYQAPAALGSAFIRITNSQDTGAGDDTNGGSQNANDVTAYISDPSNLLTSITFMRHAGAVSNTRISWEIIEYIGPDGGSNQISVRDRGNTIFGASNLTENSPTIVGVLDDEKLVPFVTAHMNPDTGRADYNTSRVTTEWNSATNQVDFLRGETGNDSAIISWAAVEFVGASWKIQRAEHTYAASGAVEVETLDAVNDLSRAFLYTQKRIGNGLTNLDEYGHEVWLSGLDEVSFQLQNNATNPALHTSVAWVIENTQISGTTMAVTRSDGSTSGGSEPFTLQVPIGKTLNDITRASIFINNRSTGTGNAHPRAILGAELISETEYELWRSDTGQTATYRTEIVEWPISLASIKQSSYRFFENTDGTDIGTGLAAQGTPAELTSFGQEFRLRQLLSVELKKLLFGGQSFKLQFAEKSVACDTGFVGETYEDITDTSVIAFLDNVSANDGDVLTANAGDPVESNPVVIQNYVESSPFSNDNLQIPLDEDGLWDFALKDNGGVAGTSYCFRIVREDDSLLETYVNIPEIRIFPGELTVDIIDDVEMSIADPGVDFSSINYDATTFQTTSGTFGIATEKIRLTNTTANAQWNLNIAPSGGTAAVWIGSTANFDYNDPEPDAGDGGDVDTVGGQMTLDPTSAMITPEIGCSTTGLTTGAITAFDEGIVDVITLLSASGSADTNCYWDLTDITINQTIPQSQPAQIYGIDMALTIVAI